LTIRASGRVVAALSPAHADLVRQLGGPSRVEMVASLRFRRDAYVGGEEAYFLARRGSRAPLLRVYAEVRVRPARTASPHTTHAQT
jgi:hypothetical protein